MKILLLIPPTDLKRSYGQLKHFSNPQPSIGLAYIGAMLLKNGYDVKLIDAYVKGYTLEELVEMIEAYSPNIIGISVLTPSADVVYEISRNIRSRFPDTKIVMGNMHASLFADDILTNGFADYIVHREGEITMLDLVKAIENNSDIAKVDGISYRQNGHIVNNQLRPHIDDLDSLPFPAWELFPIDAYSTDPRTEVKKGVVETQILATRGCPNQCTFCSSRTERSLGTKYRMRKPQFVVDEMEYMNKRFGSEVFAFMDLAFPLVKTHAIELCNEIINRGLNNKFKWLTECRVKPLDEETLALMKKAGCVRVNFGIESGDNDTLKRLKKNFTVDDVRRAVQMARKAAIEVDGMFMIGLPGETEESIRKTIDFAVEIDVRYAIFNIFVPYPGCELWDILREENRIFFKSWADFTSYPTYSGGVPVYVPKGLSKEQLMSLQTEAMRRFYFRPKFILNELKHFKIDKVLHYIYGLKGLLLKRSNSL